MSVVSYLKLSPKPEFQAEFQRHLEELTRLVAEEPGFIGVEVLRPATPGNAYVIFSEWETEDAFKAWEHSPRHQQVMDDYNQRTGQGYTKMRMDRYR